MKNWNWLKSIRLVTNLDAKIEEAINRGKTDERIWHQDKSNPTDSASIYQDDFYLYENDGGEAPKDLHNLSDDKKKVIESQVGGWDIRYVNNRGFYYYQTLEELWSLQEATLAKFFTDPHCRSIINNWTDYTIGGGIKIGIDVQAVSDVVSKFRVTNDMIKREKNFVKMGYIEGELFIPYYIDKQTGDINIRRIRPQEITDIETHPDDVETIFGYHWEFNETKPGSSQTYSTDKWIADISYYDWKAKQAEKHKRAPRTKLAKGLNKYELLQFMKFGLDTEIRGRVPLQPTLRFLKYYEDWLIDRIRLNHERAKVVWIKEIKGQTSEATTRQRRSPKGGVMLVETENVRYRIEAPQLNADDAKEDGLAILYTIGSATSLPIHILDQRSDQQNYASIRKADTPFSQFIRGNQELWATGFNKMYRQVIQSKVEAGQLPQTVNVIDYSQESIIKAMKVVNEMIVAGKEKEAILKEAQAVLGPGKKQKVNTVDIPMSLEFPEVVREDPKAQAEALQIHRDMGIVSKSTASAKAGYDWKQELTLMLLPGDSSGEPEPEKPEVPPKKKPEVPPKKEPEEK